MMRTGATRWHDLGETERDDLLRHAASTLDEGGLVIAPTETVYGVFARADRPAALERLAEASRAAPPSPPQTPPYTWHAPSAEALLSRLALESPVHRRLAERLVPGPVRLVVEQTAPDAAALLDALGLPPGVIDTDGHGGVRWVAGRVPHHPVARSLLERAGGPAVARRLGATPWGLPGKENQEIGETDGLPGAVLNAGRLPVSAPSTTVRLRLGGAFEVSEGGAVSESEVMDTLTRRILFVCTGNTCRSPMAAAIARGLLAERAGTPGIETVIESAGVATGDGLPATPEAVEAARELGASLASHTSRRLTAAMVERAEAVFVMTGGHAQAVLSIAPGAADKVAPLDPDGEVPDPIGGPMEVYRRTAARLRALIEERFESLGL